MITLISWRNDCHNPQLNRPAAQTLLRKFVKFCKTCFPCLKEEPLRVFRSKVVNSKWLESIQKHGYKGGLELTATVDYLFGYDATATILDNWMYEQTAEIYTLNPSMQEFLQENNPWALNAISERWLEAAQRKL